MAIIADHLGITRRIGAITGTAEFPGIARVGFEVELEGGNGDWPDVNGWEKTQDGSLRGNAIEYIFSGPSGGTQANNRLQAFHAAMEEYQPAPTFRCSTHIHMDMRSADWNVYKKTVLAYMVFEDLLFDHCEPYRRHSNFCVPFMNNDWFSSYFGRKVLGAETDGHAFHAISSWSKYSALNLQPTTNFGSIEFRGSHALTTTDDLRNLANRMQSLRKMAEDRADMANLEFIQALFEGNPQDLFIVGCIAADYVMDAGGKSQGYAAALNAVTQAELLGDADARRAAREREEALIREQQQRQHRERQERETLQRVMRHSVTWNLEFLRSVNIAVPQHADHFQGALQVVAALSGVGVPVRLRQVMQHRDGNAVAIDWMSQRFDQVEAYTGLRLPATTFQ